MFRVGFAFFFANVLLHIPSATIYVRVVFIETGRWHFGHCVLVCIAMRHGCDTSISISCSCCFLISVLSEMAESFDSVEPALVREQSSPRYVYVDFETNGFPEGIGCRRLGLRILYR